MIKVLLFAHLKDALGKEEVLINAAGLTIAAVKEKLAADFKLEGLDAVMAAVNEEFADEETVVTGGDIVAFIPPVSGG